MEDTLRVLLLILNTLQDGSLNPYSNGRYSEREKINVDTVQLEEVLILILMEDTLRVRG